MSKSNNNLSYEEASARYWYEPETGLIYSKHFKRPVGVFDGGSYVVIQINRKLYKAHRLAWLLHYGEWPTLEIDHINGDKSDNRLSNLREATRQQNILNRRMFKNNTTGVKGVSRARNRFRAQLWHNGAPVLSQLFDTLEEAAAAYEAKANELFGEWHRAA